MNPDIQFSAAANGDSWLKTTVTTYNFAMDSIKKITNTPFIPISRKIHQNLLPLLQSVIPKVNRDSSYFRNDIYPYRQHIYLSVALKIMERPEIKHLLEKLYDDDSHYINNFLALSGAAWAIPAEINPDVFNQLSSALQQGGALKKNKLKDNSAFSSIPRDAVLLNFFSSFISPKLFTLPAINEGIKGVLTSAITLISPGIGGTIRMIDGFNPLTSIFPHRSNEISRLLREEMSSYHLTQRKIHQHILSLKNFFNHASTNIKNSKTFDQNTASSITAVNTPLLVGATTLTLVQQPQNAIKTIVGVSSLGLAGAYAVYCYLSSPKSSNNPINENDIALNREDTNITHSVSFGEKPYSLNQLNPAGRKRTCYDIEHAIKELLISSNTGLRLVDEFCHFIFDEHGDVNINHANRLLKKWNIANYTPHDRTEMSVLLTHTLSALLTPSGRRDIFDLNELIFSTGEEVNQIWLRNLNKKPQETINDALQEVRLFISGRLVEAFGAIDLTKAEKLIDFIILLCAPDLMQFKNHNKGNLSVVSKEGYYYWNYLGTKYSDNKYVLHGDFDVAIDEGKKYGFYLRRRKFYSDISKLSPVRELFENFTSSINQDFISYHEADVKLERLIFPTLDDIIEDAYQEKGVDVFAPVNFDRESLRVNLQPYIDREEEIEYLRECKDIRDVIRSFPDGMDVLRRRLPNLVPYSLRSYSPDDNLSFVLRPHPKRDELKESYEKIYQEIYKEHMALYKSVIRMSFEMDQNYDFLRNPLVEISLVELDNRRLQKIRSMFMPKSFRFRASVMLQAAYNPRRHYQRGAIFSARHTQTNEKHFFVLNIEASRIYRQLPIISLAINKSADIAGLSNEFLDGHYKFHDGKPFWDPCDEEKEFKTSLLSRPEEAWNYITERFQFVKSKLCQATRSEHEIVPLFTEKKLGPATIAFELLQKEILNIRDKYLTFEKEAIETSRETERERDLKKGMWKLFKEKLPIYSCLEMIDDVIIPHEDIVLTSLLENIFQGVLCASDAYLISSMMKKLTGLERDLKKTFLQKMKRTMQIESLRENLRLSQAMHKISPAMEQTINRLKMEIKHLDLELKSTYEDIFISGASLASKPAEILYPIFSFGSGKTFIFPLAAALGKKEIKKLKSGLKSYTFYPWIKPSAKELLEKEHHILLSPEKKDISCFSDDSQPLNITTNIFDIQIKRPELYRKIFFTMLKNPDIQTIIDTAEVGGFKIPDNYDEMAMFCFRTFITPIWHYTGEILDLEKNYNLNANKTELNAGMFFDYLDDNLIKREPIPDITLTADQNLLIGQSVHAINRTLESNSQAFQFNYLFTLKQILLSENLPSLLRHSEIGDKEEKRRFRTILQNIHYKLAKTSLYSTHSSMQEKFHTAALNHFVLAIEQAIRERPAAITLFSPNIETFHLRCKQYTQHHPDETIPALAEFIRNQVWMENEFERIYQPFARVEYSAKVLNNYDEESWLSAEAQSDWLAEIKQYLSPQLRKQSLNFFLKNVTHKILNDWQLEKRNAILQDKMKIIIGNDINPVFISLVKAAMKKYSPIYSNLLFCQYYLIDDGNRFTFLTNDFISEPQQRSRRQIFSEHPFYPLPSLDDEALINIVTSSSTLKQENPKLNNTRLYELELNSILQNFIYFSTRPFHERLYGYVMAMLPTDEIARNDIATMINMIIDEKGAMIDYQIKVLHRYLAPAKKIDKDQVLQLLSDIFKIAYPSAPDLYTYSFRQLQSILKSPWVTLGHLTDQEFINAQSGKLSLYYQQQLKEYHSATPQAIQRYIAAFINYHLSFATFLNEVDSGMTGLPLKDSSAKQLCIGAIIAHRLQLKTASHGDLLKLFSIAMQDAGIIPVIAKRQIALLSLPGRHSGEDALQCLACCLEHTAKIQSLVLACVNSSQQLAAFLTELRFGLSLSEQLQQLPALTRAAIQSHQQLLTIALPDNKEQQFRQARDRGELQFTWYLATNKNNSHDMSVAGIGFDILNKDEGILFPYALSLSATGTFRQRPVSLTNESLTAICFDPGINHSIPFNITTVTPVARTNPQSNESVITTFFSWITAEVRHQLQQLATVKNETAFINTKNTTLAWLTRHLPFISDNDLLAEQLKSERIIKLAAHSTVNKWKLRNLPKPQNLSTIDYVDQAITDVMGKYTDWPADATALRSRITMDNTIPASELPITGFRGIWWDPMSYVCYLGFINQNERLLYASLPENREGVYSITDEFVHARIWSSLNLREALQDDFATWRRGELSAQSFFEQSAAVAWRQVNGNSAGEWHQVSKAAGNQLVRQGIFTPHSFLQHADGHNETNSRLTPYTLQYHSGNIVFIFSENNNEQASYGIIDAQGNIQILPEGLTDWPHHIRTTEQRSSEALFNAAIEQFFFRDPRGLLTEYLPLMNDTQQQQQKSLLLREQTTGREKVRLLSNNTENILFRMTPMPEGLIDIDIYLIRHGRSLKNELQRHIHQEIEFNDNNWNVFSWRNDDIYDDRICNNTLNELKRKQSVFTALNDVITKEPLMALNRTPNLISWIDTSMTQLSRSIGAIEWFKSPENRPSFSDKLTSRLHLDYRAKNTFFNSYGEQPYATPESFIEPWTFNIDQRRSTIQYSKWQQALDQLHILATEMPDNFRAIDTFLSLPENLWRVENMQTYARQFQKSINSTLNYWRQSHQAQQLFLIRPQSLTATKYNHPVSLVLSAGAGDVTGQEKAPPLLLSPEQFADLMLVNSGPQQSATSEMRLAGINSAPQTVQEFVAWSKNRLAAPVFMNELSGPAFLFRLQNRIDTVMATESHQWGLEERNFYASADTTRFLRLTDFDVADKGRFLEFFKALFASNVLVTRLILPDVEMVFGLLCDYCKTRHPERATEDFSMAWFLFSNTFGLFTEGDTTQSLYLVGV